MMVGLFFDEMVIFWIRKKKKFIFFPPRCCFFFFLTQMFFNLLKYHWKNVFWFNEVAFSKKPLVINLFFFKFKILSFREQDSYHHKIHRKYTLESKLKICRRDCYKNQPICWFFYDFGKNVRFFFCQHFGFSKAHILICM